jgi:hypothetical protein
MATVCCDAATCLKSSGEELAPLVAAKGYKAFEVSGTVSGRPWRGNVILCPGHTEIMERDIAEKTATLFFDSFEGGRLREPEWCS